MERMVEVLKYLKDYEKISASILMMDYGVSKDEIETLCDLGILYEEEENEFYISSKKLTSKMIELLLSSPREITKKELTNVFGISDYHIHKLLNEDKLALVRRGVYQSTMANEKTQDLTIPTNLTATQKIVKAIEESNLSEVLRILDETQGNEFIELSKELWKWVMIQILGKEIVNKKKVTIPESIEEEKEEVQTVLTSEERVKEPALEFKEESREKVPLEPINLTTSTMESETSDMGYTPTGLPLGELYSLYLQNKYQNPILAKEFLLEYKDQCEIHHIKFNYLDLKGVNQLIEDFNIPSSQLEKERELKKQINSLMEERLNNIDLKQLDELLHQFSDLYQERGILSTLYRGDYQAKIRNYSEALLIYNSLLKKESWNITIYHRIASVLLKTGQINSLIPWLEKSLSLVPKDDYWRSHLAFFYIDKHKFLKARDLVELENFNKPGSYEKCLRRIIVELEKQIAQYKIFAINSSSASYCASLARRIESTSLELEHYQELYSQLADYQDLEEEMLTGESLLDPYVDEVYWASVDNENGYIAPGKLEDYVQNLEISLDEELLFYIAAAKVMFIHKWPKHGEHYLKLVSKAHSENPTIKQEYQQCVKNKKLYLNK